MAKKDFTDVLNNNDPTSRFISAAKTDSPRKGKTAIEQKVKVPAGYKLIRTERRSHRMHIVVTPSLYKKIEKKAAAAEVSMNEYINRILEKELL